MKFMSLAFPFVILMDIIMFLNFVSWNKQCIDDYNQRQVDIQVNYCCDAAAQMMLQRTSHIQTDYSDWGNMKVDPEIALFTYEECLLRNLNWSVSDHNKEMLESDYIPFFCVVAYDGYYMYERVRVLDTYQADGVGDVEFESYPLVWTPKLPFSRYDEATGAYYAYNLSYGNCYRYFNNKIDTKYTGQNNEKGKVIQRDTVSKILSDACTNALKIGLYGKDVDFIYIPSNVSEIIETNAIEGPTVMTYINDNLSTLPRGTGVFGIGGTRIEENNYCVAYRVKDANGVEHKYYTYAYIRNRQEFKDKYGSIKIEKIYTNPRYAAEDGYYFDLSFIKG